MFKERSSRWFPNTVSKLAYEGLIRLYNAQKMKFSIKDFFSKCDQIRKFPADLVTFTE